MDEIIRSPVVIWTIRAVLIIVLVTGAWMLTLHFARYLRPKHIRRLVTADLPEFKDVGGKLTVFGEELSAHGTLETARDQEVRVLDRRVTALEEQVRDLWKLRPKTLKRTQTGEEPNG